MCDDTNMMMDNNTAMIDDNHATIGNIHVMDSIYVANNYMIIEGIVMQWFTSDDRWLHA